MKQIIITENQFNRLMASHIILESIFDLPSKNYFKKKIKKMIKYLLLSGMTITAITTMINHYCQTNNIPPETKKEILTIIDELPQKDSVNNIQNDWVLADTSTFATVYNAVPAQCNGDFGHTASMFRLNLYDVLSQRVIAMERTFMSKLGLKYGDVVKIEGTDGFDGVWQIQDTMNKRFAGKHKIDILVPETIRHGAWENVKLYILNDKSMTEKYKSQMAPQISKLENKRQVAAKKEEFKHKKNKKI